MPFMPGPRTIMIAACVLFLTQAAVISRMAGTPPGVLFSDLIQIVMGILCLLASLRAFHRAGKAVRYHWGWLAASFGAWVPAQALGTYIDASSNQSWNPGDDILFLLSVVPIAMLLFLDPGHEHTRFDRLHVIDFVQVSGFWVSVYLYFAANNTSIALATVGWAGFGWTSSLVFNGILTLSFLLRALLVKSTAGRGFFGGMAAYVFFSGLADSYASFTPNHVAAGHGFDLVWSSLLGIPLVIALTWGQDESLALQSGVRAQRIIVNEFFPLVYPFFTLLFLVQDARREPLLSSCIAMVVFAAVGVRVLIIQHRLLHAQDALEYEASHDSLTGIWNRASILDCLGKEVERQKRSTEPVAVLLADVDHFKAINDTYGHMVGDQVLSEVAHRLAASVRIYDSVGRYGGEEFLIIVPNCESQDAISTAERLRCSVGELPVSTAAGAIPAAISVGLASSADCGPQVNRSMLVRMADGALYRAKAKGRNRVERAVFKSDMQPADTHWEDAIDARERASSHAEGL